MRQFGIGGVILAWTACSACAQYSGGQTGGASIRWGQDVTQAVEQGKKTKMPLMFWVIGSSSDRADANDLERDQKRAFANAEVVQQSKRFVCCKMSRTQHKADLAKWGLVNANLDIVFVTPDGNKIDDLNAGAVKNADSLSQKMALVFQSYRQGIFDKQVKPVLENEKASPKELKTALDTVDEFTILTADKEVLQLLKREGLDAGVSSKAIEVLGKLATKPAVDELFDRAATDKKADEVLRKCPPIAAGYLLEHLSGPDAAKQVLAYDVVVAICKIKDPKKPTFWEGTNDRLKNEEIKRVQGIAKKAADNWKERNEQYR